MYKLKATTLRFIRGSLLQEFDLCTRYQIYNNILAGVWASVVLYKWMGWNEIPSLLVSLSSVDNFHPGECLSTPAHTLFHETLTTRAYLDSVTLSLCLYMSITPVALWAIDIVICWQQCRNMYISTENCTVTGRYHIKNRFYEQVCEVGVGGDGRSSLPLSNIS